MLILDIFAENERYDVKQNAHNPQPENIYDLHSIFSFIVKIEYRSINLAGLFETMSFSGICFQ